MKRLVLQRQHIILPLLCGFVLFFLLPAFPARAGVIGGRALTAQELAAYGVEDPCAGQDNIGTNTARPASISLADPSGGPAGGHAARGWVQDGTGWWYDEGSGRYPAADWRELKGIWYYFDPSGYMVTGLREINGKTYIFDDSGAMLSGQSYTMPDGRTWNLQADGSAELLWPYRPITVIPPDSEKSAEFLQLDSICDQILQSITSADMSQAAKADRIYSWIKGHMHYVARESGTDWVHEALLGIRSGRGDCFSYFAVSQALLTRAGMDCIQVIRSTDNNHYWNLVRADGNWYHFDTTPRTGVSNRVCLLTDAQMLTLPKADAWIFDHSLYPRTP